MLEPPFQSVLTENVGPGRLIAFRVGPCVAVGLRLATDSNTRQAGTLALTLSGTSSDLKAPKIVAVRSPRVLEFAADFAVELSDHLEHIEPSRGRMRRVPGCLAISGRTIGMYALNALDQWHHGDVCCVDLATGGIGAMPDDECVEVRGWRIRLPPTAPGDPGRVVAERSEAETSTQP